MSRITREEIILITSGVVVLTLIVQSLMLPSIIRFSRLPEDTALEEELRLAQSTASEAAYEALPALADKVGVSDVVYKRVRAEYEHHLEVGETVRLVVDGAALLHTT